MTYEDLLDTILTHGEDKEDRTGTGTRSWFGPQLDFDLRHGFPLITTKKVHMKSIVGELLWMLSGSTSAAELRDKYGVTIWDEWQDEKGGLGPVYGAQWRNANWVGRSEDRYSPPPVRQHDQISEVIESIKSNPDSRRHIVSAWNVGQINDMALAPCHALFQFNVSNGFLDCKLYQRSADMFLGVPFNIASYALLTHMVAAQTGLIPRRFIWTAGDAHIYNNHMKEVETQLDRAPRPFPTLVLDPVPSIFEYEPDNIHVVGYNPHPAIKAPVAV